MPENQSRRSFIDHRQKLRYLFYWLTFQLRQSSVQLLSSYMLFPPGDFLCSMQKCTLRSLLLGDRRSPRLWAFQSVLFVPENWPLSCFGVQEFLITCQEVVQGYFEIFRTAQDSIQIKIMQHTDRKQSALQSQWSNINMNYFIEQESILQYHLVIG